MKDFTKPVLNLSLMQMLNYLKRIFFKTMFKIGDNLAADSFKVS